MIPALCISQVPIIVPIHIVGTNPGVGQTACSPTIAIEAHWMYPVVMHIERFRNYFECVLPSDFVNDLLNHPELHKVNKDM